MNQIADWLINLIHLTTMQHSPIITYLQATYVKKKK